MSALETPRLKAVEPILAVRDVAAAVEYYKNRLGFSRGWVWGDPPTHGGVNWGPVGFQFTLHPDLACGAEGREYFVTVSNVDLIYARHQEASVEIISPLEAMPWEGREYTVRDLNGYYLRIAAPGGDREHSKALPSQIKIEVRVPTQSEYERLLHAVNWDQFVNWELTAQSLAGACFGVVAKDTQTDTVIASALALSDSATFFYVKDVMVDPNYQNQRIGTAVMEALMAKIKAIAPSHSFVELYTSENLRPFYKQWGFIASPGMCGMMVRL